MIIIEKAGSDPRRNFTRATFLAAALVLLAAFLYHFLTLSTTGFRSIGMVMSGMFTAAIAVYLLLGLIVLRIVLGMVEKLRGKSVWISGKWLVLSGMGAILLSLIMGFWVARPKNRLLRATEGAASGATHIEVAGFHGFLAQRWLYAFDATEEDVTRMVAAMELAPVDQVNLLDTINRDVFFEKWASPARAGIPGAIDTVAYGKHTSGEQSLRWVTLVFSPSARRAWLYQGYQN